MFYLEAKPALKSIFRRNVFDAYSVFTLPGTRTGTCSTVTPIDTPIGIRTTHGPFRTANDTTGSNTGNGRNNTPAGSPTVGITIILIVRTTTIIIRIQRIGSKQEESLRWWWLIVVVVAVVFHSNNQQGVQCTHLLVYTCTLSRDWLDVGCSCIYRTHVLWLLASAM